MDQDVAFPLSLLRLAVTGRLIRVKPCPIRSPPDDLSSVNSARKEGELERRQGGIPLLLLPSRRDFPAFGGNLSHFSTLGATVGHLSVALPTRPYEICGSPTP